MDKIVKKDGKVYLVENWDNVGFETFIYMGLDPSLIEEEKEEKPKNKKKETEKKDEN